MIEDLTVRTEAPSLMLAVAGWMRYVGGVDERGQATDVCDPLADKLRTISSSADGTDKARALLGVREVFSESLARAIEPGVVVAYGKLLGLGARRAVESLS